MNSRQLGKRLGRKIKSGLSAALKAKFLYLWTGRYDGDNLLSNIGPEVITVTGKDWSTIYIDPDTTATFAVPNNAIFIAADGTDDFWFDAADALQQKTHTELIESTTERTFVHYSDEIPYNIHAIGILKNGETISDDEKADLTKYFKLWVQYWSAVMLEAGHLKTNRTLIED